MAQSTMAIELFDIQATTSVADFIQAADGQELELATLDTPLASLEFTIKAEALVGIDFILKARPSKYGNLTERVKKPASRLMLECQAQVIAYLKGECRDFHVPLRLEGTEFQLKVWDLLLKIPYGETRTYGDLARELGSIKWSRAVGGANNKNPIPLIVPCHRVIGTQGKMVGFAPGVEYKTWLLKLEQGLSPSAQTELKL